MVWVFASIVLVLVFFIVVIKMSLSDPDISRKEIRKARRTREHLDEAVVILKWLRSEEAAMTGITYDSEIRNRITTLLEKVKKEYE